MLILGDVPPVTRFQLLIVTETVHGIFQFFRTNMVQRTSEMRWRGKIVPGGLAEPFGVLEQRIGIEFAFLLPLRRTEQRFFQFLMVVEQFPDGVEAEQREHDIPFRDTRPAIVLCQVCRHVKDFCHLREFQPFVVHCAPPA